MCGGSEAESGRDLPECGRISTGHLRDGEGIFARVFVLETHGGMQLALVYANLTHFLTHLHEGIPTT